MIYFLSGLILLFSRLPFAAKYLFNWDSVQFAFALDVFNISFHQPHPPGYFLYVCVASVLNIVTGNANLAYILEGIIFFVLAIFVFFNLSKLVFNNIQKVYLAVLIFIFNPVVWFYSSIAAVYMVDLFFSLFFVLLAWKIAFKNQKNIRQVLIFSFVFGLSIGFRQTLLLFFGPLWVLSMIFFYYNTTDKKIFSKVLIKAIMVFLLGLLIWLIPTSYLSGGFFNYLALIKEQFGTAGKATSLFQQAGWHEIFAQVKKFLKSIFLMVNFSILFLIVWFINVFKSRHFNFKNTNLIKKVLIFVVWLVPSYFVYCLVHFAQVGYLFTIAGAIFLLLATALYTFLTILKSNLLKMLAVFIFILLQCIIFVYGWEVFRPKNFIAIQKIYDKIIDYRISPHQLDFPAIKHNDQKIETIINTVNSFKPESTVVITEFGSPYVNPYENWSENFRTVSYYLPEYEVYELFWGNEKKYFKTQNYSLPQLIHSNKIILSSEKKYIVFLNTTEKTLLPNDNLLENTKPYIVNIETTEDFKYLGYKFIYKK